MLIMTYPQGMLKIVIKTPVTSMSFMKYAVHDKLAQLVNTSIKLHTYKLIPEFFHS